MIELAGGTVTIDAMGCQKEIATQIIEQGGEYILALKRNHPHLYRDVQATFATRCDAEDATVAYHATIETGYRREEMRRYWITSDLGYLIQ